MSKQTTIAEFYIRLSGGKTLRYTLRPRKIISRLTAVLMLLVGALPAHALDPNALPTGGAITAGSGNIRQSGSRMDVDQSSAKLAAGFSTFNIGASAQVNVNQPSSNAQALFRVAGGASEIQGKLSANGQVFLINPNGVLFGKTAQVDVGGLVATTLNLSDADFLAGKTSFAKQGAAGSVINQGKLTAAQGGYIALMAPDVRNEGVIVARLGTVALGAGDKITLDFSGDRLINLVVDEAALNALAENKHLIQADGGMVLLAARAAGDLAATVVNNQGVIEARSVSNVNGLIRLDGGNAGIVANSGKLDASGLNAGETGGTIHVTGDKVALLDGAQVSASGYAGGGTVLIGGDYQGKNAAVHNASATYVAPTASVDADATQMGDGGKVVLWADDATRFYGHISARGGVLSGDGGFVETSGKAYLDAQGQVDAASPFGAAGLWLLDPNNITIQTTGPNSNISAGPIFTTTTDSAVLTVASILASLNVGTSVTVTTGTAAPSSQAGNITVANAIGKTGGANATLTLNATNNITFNAGANLTSTVGQLNVTLNAGAGGISNLRNVNTLGGVLTLNAPGAVTQGGVISGAGSLAKQGSGTFTLSSANTYTGLTTINAGTLAYGVNNALATGGVTVSGGTLNIGSFSDSVGAVTLVSGNINGTTGVLSGTSYAVQSGSISAILGGAGAMTKTTAGTVTLSGNNAYTGLTTVSAGTLAYGVNNALATGGVTVSGGTLNIGSFSDSVGAVTLVSGNINGTSGVLSGTSYAVQSGSIGAILGGAGAMTKTTAGTVTLAGNNSYTGGTTISAGTLQIGAGGTTGSVVGNITDNATLVFNRSNALTFGGVIGGSGALTQAGASTLTLTGANTYTGATTVNAGTLQVGATNALSSGSALTLNGTSILDLNGYSSTIGSLAGVAGTSVTSGVAGSATLSAGGNNTSTTFAGVMQNGSGTVALSKVGSGTLTLSGNNTNTGATTISAGTLQIGAGGASGSVVGNITDNATLAFNRSDAITYGAVISGAGALTKLGAGTLTLSGANTYTGGTTISAGTLQIGAGGATGSIVGNVTDNATLVFNRSNALTFGGVISGTGALIQAGAGTLTLTGNNLYSGLTTVNAGTLAYGVNNALGSGGVTVNSGTLDIGSFSDSVGAVALVSGNINGTSGILSGTSYAVQSGSISAILGGAGAMTKTTAGTVTLSGNNTYTGGTTISAGTLQIGVGGTTGSVVGNITDNATLVFNRSNALTFGGVISGTGAMTQAGTGTLTLTGANTYTGLTTVNAGTLAYGVNNALATGGITVSGGTLNIGSFSDSVGAVTLVSGNINGTTGVLSGTTYAVQSGSISAILGGAGALTKTTAGTVTLSGNNTFTGLTTISAGTLAYGVNNALATGGITVSGGTLGIGSFSDSVGAVTLVSGNINGTTGVLSGTSYAVQSGNISAILGGAGAMTKTTAGTVTLSGANTYSGVTTVSAGILDLQNSSALGATSGGTTVASGAAIQIDGSGLTIAENITSLIGTGVANSGALRNLANGNTWSGNITLGAGGARINSDGGTLTLSGNVTGAALPLTVGGAGNTTITGIIGTTTGTLSKDGTGTLTLTGANAYTGVTTISAGTLQVGAGGTTGNIVGNITDNATLIFNRSNALSYGGVISGTGAMTQAGSGTLTLTGANTYSGLTTVNAGTLAYGVNNALGSGGVTVNSGTLDIGSFSDSVGAVALVSGNINGTSGILSGTSYAVQSGTIGAILAGAGAMTKTTAGTVTLSGNNTYAGGTTISAGTLQVGAGGTTGSIFGNVTDNATLIFNRSNALTFGGVISGTGTLTQAGSGTLTLSGNNTYTGATNVNAGTLKLGAANRIADASTITVAAGATFDLAGFSETVASINSAGTVTLGTGATFTTSGAQTYTGQVTGTNATLVSTGAGAAISATNASNDFNGNLSITTTSTGSANIFDTNTLALGAVSTGSLIARSTGDLTLNGVISVAGATGTPLVLATNGHFFNNVGAGALTTGGGRWLVYSADPMTGNKNGLIANFKQYNTAYGGGILGSGNGYIYAYAPIATPGLTGSVSKTYDGNTSATLNAGNYTVSGAIDGDTLTLNNPTTGSYADKNAGSGKTVNVSGLTVSASNGPMLVYGYQLAGVGNVSGNVGVINKAALTIAAQTNTKIYDGTTSASATPTATGLQTGDSVTGLAATYDTKNAGSGKTLSVSAYMLNDGNGGNNYNVTTTTNNTGVINKAALTIAAQTNTKTYDGTTTAAATPTVTGLQTSDSVTGLAATYDTKNAGTGKTLSVSAYTLNDGNSGNNYNVTTTTNNSGVINKSALTVSAAGINKIYDGSTTATVTLSDNRVAGDLLTDSYTSASFADKNAATGKTVSIAGIGIAGADAGNYTFNTTATTTANITGRALTVSATGTNKVYDGTTAATVTLADNRIAGDVLTDSYTSASFADKNAATSKSVSVSGISIAGLDAGNYTANSTATTTANITPRALIVSATGTNKVYDGTTAAKVTLADNRIAGDVLIDSYTSASFADKNAATGKRVSVAGIGIAGLDAGNYTANSAATTTANIGKAALTILADDKAKLLGAVNPPLTASYSGLVPGDTPAVISLLALNTPATTASPVGAYSITPSGATAANYTIAYVDGTLAVTAPSAPSSPTTPSSPPIGSNPTNPSNPAAAGATIAAATGAAARATATATATAAAGSLGGVSAFLNALPATAAGSSDDENASSSETITEDITAVGCGIRMPYRTKKDCITPL